MSVVSDLKDSRGLLVNLTLREVRGKYKRTLLGQGWSLLNPIATLLIYTLVFGFVLRVPVPVGEDSGLQVFVLFLACALLPWNFFNNAVSSGMGSLIANANLLRKVFFWRPTLVVATVLSLNVTFAIELGVLVVLLLVFGSMPLPWIPLLVVVVVLLTAFALGIALLLSIANVYFRDTQHFVTIGMQLWFYATPIVYPYQLIQDQAARMRAAGNDFPLETIYRLNPLERFVSVFRAMLYDNVMPYWGDLLFCLVAAVGSLVIGIVVFNRSQHRLVEEL
ncbi:MULTISPECIES: ABC transporter permease [Modestobacter]|jgi:ABC-type polysaccharide/polyol phosphate export permease|uniref:Transport permease protein n=1 Tax=Modestobacter caceresii TaxID=1522368 RepID=A0A098YBB2_9ACTN|nr:MULTISPECIES: ABC transporter permease [Modestobacter]KGH48113.1 ABC transporter [Modestobacter caceresii]